MSMFMCGKCGYFSDSYEDVGSHICVIGYRVGFDQKDGKCDICGSTAIDHTEAQCAMNRTINQVKALTPSPKEI